MWTSKSNAWRGAVLGLCAAASFGVSAPLARLLLGHVTPVLLAGLLYLGAACGLWLFWVIAPRSKESPLSRRDLGRLSIVVVAGGVVAPVALMFGLMRVTGLTGVLLLNLEAPLTVLLAVVWFREHLGRRAGLAVAAIFGGVALLTLRTGPLGADVWGVLLVCSACVCWAIDNNVTRALSLRDPFAIVRVKTLVAGVVNTALGLFTTVAEPPAASAVAGAMVLGSVSYGISVVLDAYALRYVGAAREAAYFATAPFVGALLSVVVLGDPFGPREGVAMLAMAAGVIALLREEHAHFHVHEELEHDHLHSHDEHHQHSHRPGDPAFEPHSHAHRHGGLAHAHPHVSDLHHRHRH